MLLRNETLTPETRAAFGLQRNPFIDEIQTRADVYASKAVRYIRAGLLDAALNHGFVAVVGESGSGKSTLADELEQRILDEGRPVRIIRPYVLGMEASEAKGKPMRSAHISEAIMRTLAPSAPLRSSPDARFHQVHETLKASRQAGYSHLVLIEEAHCMPRPTFRHLKRYLELKQGLARLVGVALVAQPELLVMLSDQSPDMREVVQRLEILQLPALDGELEAYIAHKLQRAGAQAGAILADDAYSAIRARLIRMPRGGKPSDAISVCHPLIVNNLLARALNAAALVGMARVDASVIEGC
jgi:type II secretory pathway predicted ATPase ExeA